MKKILIVEDEPIVALELQDRLEKLGYNIIDTVSTGEQAIKTTEETNPDLILMDIHLKGEMDGIKTAQHIKHTQNIPIIYLTAYADDETLNRARITTPYAYIVKPFEERELQSNIEIALYKHQTEQKLQHTKNHLQNIVEHITEIIFTINQEHKITTWNNSAEQLTGYPKKEVLGKTITDLPLFPHPEQTKHLLNQKQPTDPIRLHLQTAANEQKIIQINQITPLHNQQQKSSLLIIGTDITETIQKLNQFQPGNTYLLPQTNHQLSLPSLINYFTSCQHQILLITRKNTQPQHTQTTEKHLHTLYLTNQPKNNASQPFISNTKELSTQITEYCNQNQHVIIILTNIDYFIIQQGFTTFMKTMYYITDLINDTNNRFFITYNPSILNNQQQALLKQVVTELPHNHLNSMVLTEELHTVLEFIQQQKNKGSLVTLKKIKQQLELSYPTIKKRLSELEEKGLILRRKQGRSKTVHISQKGEQLLNQT